MEIAEAKTWQEFLAESGNVQCRLVAHPGQGPRPWPVPNENAVLAVGPEGGFTDEEIALAIAQGWQPVDLGPRTLRVETAAVALAARVIG